MEGELKAPPPYRYNICYVDFLFKKILNLLPNT